jgi:protein-tyrosine-phosphatase
MRQDAVLAREVAQLEELVDVLKSQVNADLIKLFRDSQIPLEVLHPLMTIARRLERVSDQARSIGIEVLYVCTGEDTKHRGSDVYRILFVDDHDADRSLMGTAIGNSLQQVGFLFDSAGVDPRPPEAPLIEFMRSKGADLSRVVPKSFSQVPHLDEQDVIVALSPDVKRLLPQMPRKALFLDWNIPRPTHATYEETYQAIREHLKDLMDAIVGNNNPQSSS